MNAVVDTFMAHPWLGLISGAAAIWALDIAWCAVQAHLYMRRREALARRWRKLT